MDSRFCERPGRTKGKHKARTRPEGRPGSQVRGGRAATVSRPASGEAPPYTVATATVTGIRRRPSGAGNWIV